MSDNVAAEVKHALELFPNVKEIFFDDDTFAWGKTRVLCAASVLDQARPFKQDTGEGWVTAEYAMLPRSTHTRQTREARGRSQEIQRLIGRVLRAVVDLKALGERTVVLDCDVLQADGGTRTAAVTGALVLALALALQTLCRRKVLDVQPLKDLLAAVSVGLVDTPQKALAAGHALRRADGDLIFLHVTTYALSSTVLPVVRRSKAPVVVLNLAPAPAIGSHHREDLFLE